MKTIYIDAYSGIAGDMMVGGLFSLFASTVGFDTAEEIFRSELKKLKLDEFDVEIRNDRKGGLAGVAFRVHDRRHHSDEHHEHEHHHRGLKEIQEIFMKSDLAPAIVRDSIRAFALLAEAEAKVHGTTVDEIHFHEVGAIDSIVDIAGTFILFNLLKCPRVLSSPLNVGSGTVRCAHGVLPVPAPATIEILKDIPIYSLGIPMERVTPTGALIVRCLASGFSTLPASTVTSVGYGLGEKDCPDIPNALRLVLLDSDESANSETDFCVLIEANIDDMNPQDFAPVMEKLFNEGALDVWIEPIYMKKNRPAQKFCCLAPCGKDDLLGEIILRQTTTQGFRKQISVRNKLAWKIEETDTPIGKIRVKVSRMGNEQIRRVPEHDDLKRAALEHGLSLYDARIQVLKSI